ncbi:MAG: 3-isopropylmalate dehydratase large subunit [Bacillota bacterium]|jgi:3-isopropylmalate/(R)-2-methylmalate dehydratase large subunit
MAMTVSEKILSAHAGRESVSADELIFCDLDLVLANDITASPAIDEFNKLGLKEVWDRDKIALVADHFVPNKDIQAATQVKKMENFALEQKITNYFPITGGGIEHILLPDRGLVKPGNLMIGADSHTCTHGAFGAFATGVGSTDAGIAFATGKVWLRVPKSIKIEVVGKLQPWVSGKDIVLSLIGRLGVDGALYQTLEFCGEGLSQLSIADRSTIANMAVEAGAKNALFPVDNITKSYLARCGITDYPLYEADAAAEYVRTLVIDLGQIPLTVACPPLPSNTVPVDDIGRIAINQAVIGSCTNGRIEDLRQAAAVMKGHKVNKHVRCLVMPGTHDVYKQALQEGLLEIFAEADAVITMPTCGPCLGGHCGVLSAGEVAVATTNRNFVGRMGHPDSFIYLASPAVAAASSLIGRICSPQEAKVVKE